MLRRCAPGPRALTEWHWCHFLQSLLQGTDRSCIIVGVHRAKEGLLGADKGSLQAFHVSRSSRQICLALLAERRQPRPVTALASLPASSLWWASSASPERPRIASAVDCLKSSCLTVMPLWLMASHHALSPLFSAMSSCSDYAGTSTCCHCLPICYQPVVDAHALIQCFLASEFFGCRITLLFWPLTGCLCSWTSSAFPQSCGSTPLLLVPTARHQPGEHPSPVTVT